MSAERARTPWVLWAVAMMLLVGLFALSFANHSFGDDTLFIPLGVTMILGYTTVGALLASRNPHNPIGWLMMTIGGGFVLGGFCDEYVRYTYITDPGALPGGLVAAWVVNWVYSTMLPSLALIGLLFPTGRVPGPRWRFLMPLTIGAGALAVVGSILSANIISDLRPSIIVNPTGVRGFPQAVAVIGWMLTFVALTASIAAVVVRYRRAVGEERQQIRWLAYIAIVAVVLVPLAVTMATVVGNRFGGTIAGQVLSFAGFALVGIGVPVALGVAVLKYRLYDLDVVVKKTVVFAILVVLLMAFGAVVLLFPGTAFLGVPSEEQLLVLILGAALGLLLVPIYRLAKRIADRVVYGGRAEPYEVLTRFSSRLSETYASDDVLPRTTAILGEGTGAERVTVWLLVAEESVPASTWPAEATEPARGQDFEVRHQGELLGSITVTMPSNDPMNAAKERLIRDLASQAGLVLRNVRLIEELRASRRRLVAAQDEERRRLERNIHDGAQQQLVALTVKLRLADQLVDRDVGQAHELLAQLQRETHEALDDLRDLARGIYPPLLADDGLPAAIEAQARKMPVPVTVEPDGVGRHPQEVEAAVYFCVLEALQNVAKYAEASSVTIALTQADARLTFEVRDDGAGFDPAGASRGTGLRGMADRVEAVGGSLEVISEPGRGTTVSGAIPIG